MPYSLVRTGDGAGDSGPMSRRLWPDKHEDTDPKPIVGATMMVGSIMARTYQMQDWWQTTLVTEIISDDGDTVVFRTQNSEYTWRHF
jgi:hypothetical protein